MDSNESWVAKVYLENRELNKKNDDLLRENEELVRLLSAKRYKLVDSAIDVVYRIIRKKTKKEQTILEVEEEIKQKSENTQEDVVERSVVCGKVDIVNMNFSTHVCQ